MMVERGFPRSQCLIFLQENRLNARGLKDFPAPTMRFSMIVIETLVVVGKRYASSEHPAACMLLNEMLGRSDCTGLNGAERRLLGGRANS